jgi:acetyl-CoA synthetase
MDVAVFRSDGTEAGPGEVGELVCRQPWPAMTRGLRGDPERYLNTYWRRFPGVWTHGDWASVDEEGFWFLHGRSDDTLNVAGKRLGPAEVESILTLDLRVAESAVVGIPDAIKGEAICCFVVLRPGVEAGPDQAEELRARVAEHLGPAFRPSRIVFVPELPRTRSAKILRRAIRAVVAGEDPGDLSSLENPSALEAIREATR